MDPDEALKMMREALEALHGPKAVTRRSAAWYRAVIELSESSCTLDTWMANGGFLPAGWMIHRQAV